MKRLTPTAILLVLVLLNLLAITPLITTAEGIIQATPKILVYEVRVFRNETLTNMTLLPAIVLIVSNNEVIPITPIGYLAHRNYWPSFMIEVLKYSGVYRVKYDELRNTLLLELSQPLTIDGAGYYGGLRRPRHLSPHWAAIYA